LQQLHEFIKSAFNLVLLGMATENLPSLYKGEILAI
jgi:hypothetical protein